MSRQATVEKAIDPEAFQSSIRSLLNDGNLSGARELAAEAVAMYPGDQGLEQMHHFLRPGRVTRSAALEPDRSRAFARLREETPHLRGLWVALSEDDVVASAETLKELLAVIQPMALDHPPLVHFIE